MKKHATQFIICCLFLLGFAHLSKAQWIVKGATWHYNWGNFDNTGFDKIVYEKDTSIQGRNCQQLMDYTYFFTYESTYPYVGGGKFVFHRTDTMSNYLSASGDTVFWLHNNKFHVLYNFGAKAGDTWELEDSITDNQHCKKPSTVKVDSTGTEMINGHSCRWLVVSMKDRAGAYIIHGKINDHIGSSSFLFPQEQTCTIDGDAIYNFTCFQDSVIGFYTVINYDCESLLKSGTESIYSPAALQLYPNPVKEVLTLENPGREAVSVGLYDMMGRLIFEKQLPVGLSKVDMQAYPSGMYFLETRQYGTTQMQKILKD